MVSSADQCLDGIIVGSIDATAAPKTLESTIAERITGNIFPVVHPNSSPRACPPTKHYAKTVKLAP